MLLPKIVFVVYLDHRANRLRKQGAQAVRIWQGDRISVLLNAQKKSWEGVFTAWWDSTQLVNIIPKENLGLFGLLDFRAVYARKQIVMGYRNTLEQLEEHCASRRA